MYKYKRTTLVNNFREFKFRKISPYEIYLTTIVSRSTVYSK